MTTKTTEALSPAAHLARAALYRFLATAFRYPEPVVLEVLRGGVPARPALDPALAPGHRAALEAALERLRGAVAALADADALEHEFVRTFGHAVPKEYPPYETEFTAAQAFRQTAELGDIAGFYRAFGVRVVPGIGERADAIDVELEFLHLLATKWAIALDRSNVEHGETVASATRRFLADHLARWAPSFARRLEEKGGSAVYGALAAALSAWIRADLSLLGVEEPPALDEPVSLHAPDWGEEATGALGRRESD